MSDFGIEIYDENGAMTLGMDDFTVRKIYEIETPAEDASSPNNFNSYYRDDYLEYSIPGYDPAKCFIVVTPKTYVQGEQGVGNVGPFLPYYVDLGGERIAVYTYILDDWYDYSNSRYLYRWRAHVPACLLEVYKVL